MNIKGKVTSAKHAFNVLEASDEMSREIGLEIASRGAAADAHRTAEHDKFIVVKGCALWEDEVEAYLEYLDDNLYLDDRIDSALEQLDQPGVIIQ